MEGLKHLDSGISAEALWLWLCPVDSAVRYVVVREEGTPGNSEPSQAFQSGKGLTTNSCWEGALPFLNCMALIRHWKARWLKMFLWTGHKAWRREIPLTESPIRRNKFAHTSANYFILSVVRRSAQLIE